MALGNDYTFTPGALIDLPDVNSAVQVHKLTELYDRYYDVATDAERGGAFQLALWEIMYDPNNTDLSTGNNFAARSVSMSCVEPKTEITVRPRGKPRALGLMSASGSDSLLTVGPPAVGMPRTITP